MSPLVARALRVAGIFVRHTRDALVESVASFRVPVGAPMVSASRLQQLARAGHAERARLRLDPAAPGMAIDPFEQQSPEYQRLLAQQAINVLSDVPISIAWSPELKAAFTTAVLREHAATSN